MYFREQHVQRHRELKGMYVNCVGRMVDKLTQGIGRTMAGDEK